MPGQMPIADNIMLEFLRVFIGGALFGVVMGFIVCELLFRMKSGIEVILTSSVIIAYASFVVAEHSLHVSGVMAVVGSAIALRRFGVTRFRQDATHSISEIWEVIALSCNSLLFLLVGLSVSVGALFDQLVPILIAIGLVLSARALSVYGVVPFAVKRFRLPHISLGERHIMWWGGLKGGLAIAVVLSIPASLPERQMLFEITLGVVLFTLLFSAPTIRPLMQLLGLSEITRGESLEYRNTLHHAGETSGKYMSDLAGSKIVPRATVTALREQGLAAFSSGVDGADTGNHEDDEYFAEFRARRVEREVLKSLYETGVVNQYIYLDMNNRLEAVQESLRLGEGRIGEESVTEDTSLFERLEEFLLGKIREKSRFAGLLSKFQEVRMVQQVQRDLAHILLCDGVTSMLERQDDLLEEAVSKVRSVYKIRKKHYRRQLKQFRAHYPDFYMQYVERLTARAMINSGWNRVKSEYAHGDLGAKGFNLIQHKVEAVLADVDSSRLAFSATVSTVSEYLEDLDLFNELIEKDFEYLEQNSSLVTFLEGDTIIGHYEQGEDFYVLVDGIATVWILDNFNRNHFMAEFLAGISWANRPCWKNRKTASTSARRPSGRKRLAP